MATLIQSKQIEGVVTASVIEGEFKVSGSFIATGSNSIFGAITASAISSSGPIYGVRYNDIDGTPSFIGGTGITITQVGDVYTITNDLGATDNTGSDSQILSIVGDQLTISDGNTVTIPTGSGGGGVSSWNQLSDIPSGLVSGSSQVIGILTSLNDFTSSYLTDSASFDSRISGISASGSGADWNTNLQNIPTGLISGSSQLTSSYDSRYALSGSTGTSDFTELTNIPSGLLSSSEQLPGGLISGSTQVTDGSGILSASVDFATYSSSVQTTIDNITHTQIPGGTISGSQQITDLGFISSSTSVPEGTISSSAQITALGFTSGSHTELPSGLLSASVDFATYSSSVQTTIDNIVHTQIPSGTISGSSQLTSSLDSRYALSGSGGSGTSDFTQLTNVPSGLVSSSEQVLGGTGILSGSHTDISSLNNYTSSTDSRISSLESFTGSLDSTYATDSELTSLSASITTTIDNIVHTQIPAGTISGSEQISLLGFISESFSTGGTNIFSGSLVAGENVTINQDGNNFIISSSASGGGSTSVTVSDSAPNSPSEGDLWWKSDDGNLYVYYDSYWVISIDTTNALPSGVISGSSQLTSSLDSRYALSGSGGGGVSDYGDLTNVPANIISGSQQITDLGFISSSHTDISSLNDYTASNDIKISNLESTTSSLEQRIGQIESNTSSYESHSDLSSLNTFSSSIQTEVNGLSAQTSSYLTTLPSDLVSGSSQLTSSYDTRYALSGSGTVPSGTISGSSQLTSSFDTRYALSGSGGSADTTYDGNRVISNEDLGDLFTNSVNPGTSGSIQDFLNAVFYPNTAPSISTGNQTILEYVSSGSSVVTLSGTDPEGQSITFGTASSYTDDLVRVESGVLKLNALAESSSFNTDSVGGGHGHLVTVTATDTFGTTTEKDIYVIVTPNEAPKFRQTSVGGSVITSFTANLNENSPNSTVVGTIYFTDEESDTITIYSSSIDRNEFTITKNPTNVQIIQNTGSLNYENQTQYTFSISASDEHFEAGQDSDSITTLPITINVTDNVVPVVNNQTLSSINENSSNGATVDTIAASDSEGDTITFVDFTLYKLELDNVDVSSGSYGGTSQLTDPHENPFQMSTSGVVTRKNGVYLNSDLINEYQYTVSVRDSYNEKSSPAIVTIPITDDTPATLSDNWSAGPYIKESEVSSTTIKTTNYGSTQADYNSNQSGTWSSSNPAISINSNGSLSLGVDLSGSVTQSGDTLDSTITFTNTFGTTTTDSLSVVIVANGAPTATFTNQSSNFNTNLATDGTTMVSMSITDTEGDTPYSASLGGTNSGDLQLVYTNSNSSSVGIQANGNLSAGTYNYDVVVTDSYSESTTYSGRSFTVASASTGTLSTNGTLYVIESATNGDNIVLNSNGRTGTQGSVSVSYSPNYGSQSAGSFTSSNNLISINSSTGVLSVGNDISGSGNVNGGTITSTIGWTDQYGNVGSDTITVNVSKNNAPSVSSTQTFNTNTNQATGSSEIVRLNLSDTEGDTIPNSSLSFTNYNSTYFTPSISTPQMKLLVNSTSIPAGDYPYTASIEDEHGFETRVHSGSVTINQADTGTLEDDTAIYIIESALSGSVFRDQTGFGLGSPAQVSVSYSPSYGSPVVQSFTSSNEAIVIDSSGNLTLGLDISGSVTQSGDTFTSTITFDDQYGNVGSGSVTATVFGNSSPSANFTDNSLNSDEAISGSDIGTLTVTDTENNSPFTITLAGTDGGKFDVSGSASPFTIEPTGSLAAGSYSINITVTDSYGESVTLTNESIVVSQAADYGKVYIYTSTRTGGGTLSNSNYDGILGITSENTSFEPDLITGYQSTGPSPIYAFKTGDLGTSSITVGGGALSLRNTVSGSNLDTIISSSFSGNGSTAEQIMIIFPSGSDMDGIPTSMTDTLGGSTSGEYVLYVKAAGESSFTAAGTQIHMFDVDSAVEGYTRWNIIGRNSVNTAASFEVRLIPSSGSAP